MAEPSPHPEAQKAQNAASKKKSLNRQQTTQNAVDEPAARNRMMKNTVLAQQPQRFSVSNQFVPKS